MSFFKLLAGLMECNDPDWVKNNPDPKEGEVPPSKVFKAGDVVESDTDLVARFGPEKFLYVGEERPSRQVLRQQQRREAAAKSTSNMPPLQFLTQVMGLSEVEAQSVIAHSERTKAQVPVPSSTTTPADQPNLGVDEDSEMSEAEYHAALDKMSLNQLRAHAAEEEVEIPSGATKADIVRILKAR